ncbi:MAG: FAD-dependent oxidoreductase [Acidimicrobiaceae bacterium]|nr:FAD-dependent oxidoreductase [Acidimicrobiaceae bacterium]
MNTPAAGHYDTVIVGGAVHGSSVAYWLSENPDYDGTVLVVEPDPTYERSSTTLSEASVRHQFSNPVNIALSQFATGFFADFHTNVEVGGEAPDLAFRETGYLFLATEEGMPTILENHEVQRSCGVDAAVLSVDDLRQRFPYLHVDDLAGASLGLRHEGNIDAHALLQGFSRRARHNGVEYLADRVVGLRVEGAEVTHVDLAGGATIGCNQVVNCAGPRGAVAAAMAGLALPVEARIRSVFVFDCREPLEGQLLPLTIDPSGLHFRTDPPHYLAGMTPDPDTEVDFADFRVRREDWEERIWPALAHRVPAFERIGLTHTWAGHYAYNTLDQNAVVGPADAVPNFYFANGFSGHGLQQSPGVGRGLSELITYGEYRTLDLSELSHDRIVRGEPFLEKNII